MNSVPVTATWASEKIELFDNVFSLHHAFFNHAVCIIGDKGVIQNQDLSVNYTTI